MFFYFFTNCALTFVNQYHGILEVKNDGITFIEHVEKVLTKNDEKKVSFVDYFFYLIHQLNFLIKLKIFIHPYNFFKPKI